MILREARLDPMDLKEYRNKRKFQKTPEPAGKLSKRKGALQFVVQKHDATRTHYDFRIELDGVLKSWAVPRGPSMSPLDQRLAVKVEDHPLEYGGFEGVIPKGNYGAGVVMIWDKGNYVERTSKARKDSEEALRKGLAAGKITIVLDGQKLKGEFALVRLKGKDPKAWLLIKKRDRFARDSENLLQDKSAATSRTMKQIAEESAARNDIWLPGKGKGKSSEVSSIPRQVRPMLPVAVFSLPTGTDWLFEKATNGIRAMAQWENGKVRIYSRGLLALEGKYPKIAKSLQSSKESVLLDGEIVDGRYLVFDLIYFDGQDLRSTPLIERKKKLSKLKFFDKNILLVKNEVTPPKTDLIAKKKSSLYHGGLSRDWLRVRQAVAATGSAEDLPPLHNMEKIFWPREGYSKGDVVRYYDSVSSIILPYLVDHPQSLHRQPDGVKNEGFFHKDMVGYLPRRIETVRVHSRSANKTVNYLLCQDRWTLLYLANMGCIELNPWLSRRQNLDKPDYVVIDLDPDGNEFDEVIEVARLVRKVLESLKIKSLCKTSGATGLHICIPTNARYDFEMTRIFAEKICQRVHVLTPSNTSIQRSPAVRKGKIYLDFLQNRRGQTLAAPYSLRPRPGATVSAPLRWSEVKPGLRAEQFDIETMKKRLSQVGDLWKPMLRGSVNLEKAMKELSREIQDSKPRKR
jgi:DNA ligase D-like protein (predicted polymerase)/DNA ligase D-like protein (predicted 3'-phosphoesterase)